jgi:hypothetical protein
MSQRYTNIRILILDSHVQERRAREKRIEHGFMHNLVNTTTHL